MKVFMIGGTGLLGSEGARELIARGHEVVSIALPPLPEAMLPPEMKLTLGNYLELSDEEIRGFMHGCEGFVFAAGVDERVEGPPPIYDMYVRYNIAPVERFLRIAREEGVKHAVVLGSYFAYFNDIWKEQHLYETHPYVRSRVEQARIALSFADEKMSVAVLQLPYIFGSQAGRKPVWVFLVEMLRKMKGVALYPKGGTTMVTVRQVGQCIASALERTVGGRNYPVGYYNMTWKEMLHIFHKYMGVPNKPILTIPTALFRLSIRSLIRANVSKGSEPGLNPVGLVELMTSKAYIDKRTVVEELGVQPDDIDVAIGQSVRLCLDILEGKKQAIGMKGE